MKVKDIMTREVVTVTPNTPVTEVANLMKNYNIGSVPVCEGNRVVGIITDRDIVLRDVAYGKNPGEVLARDVMTVGITTINSDNDIHDAARLMAEKQIRRLPVVEDGRLVGMLALGDIAVTNRLQDDAGEALSDISKPNDIMF
ncbi:CBS domain-containing protein [Caloramator sp. mosi_1]|uniref:CBS domain-containing protein n=1 Tax=Caloramator sp. mosi_1 TaxID=3023090 RepID=UPI00235EE3DA|nr:CBS domain-containing protein [Caloramator sp. mosi_1]WDC84599.1 CBS domain-containing protein [Caloramator sp. mosi_1]